MSKVPRRISFTAIVLAVGHSDRKASLPQHLGTVERQLAQAAQHQDVVSFCRTATQLLSSWALARRFRAPIANPSVQVIKIQPRINEQSSRRTSEHGLASIRQLRRKQAKVGIFSAVCWPA